MRLLSLWHSTKGLSVRSTNSRRSMSRQLQSGILVVQSQPSSPEREDEYNKWYSHHSVDAIHHDGFVSVRRFRKIPGNKRLNDGAYLQYIAIYEISGIDLHDPMKRVYESLDAERMETSDSVGFDPRPSLAVYEQIDEATSSGFQ